MGGRNRFSYHLQENLHLYLVVSVCFVIGIGMGAAVIHFLSPERLAELASYLDVSLAGLSGTQLDQRVFVQKALSQNFYFLLAVNFLGLTVIGIPLVVVLIWLRGFMLGFTVGFLITEKAGAGILLAAVAILPQNIFYIPAFVVAGAMAIGFSSRLIKGRQAIFQLPLWEQFLRYVMFSAGVLVLVGIGGLVESYFTPVALRWLLSALFH